MKQLNRIIFIISFQLNKFETYTSLLISWKGSLAMLVVLTFLNTLDFNNQKYEQLTMLIYTGVFEDNCVLAINTVFIPQHTIKIFALTMSIHDNCHSAIRTK